jgi:hypothetical protein
MLPITSRSSPRSHRPFTCTAPSVAACSPRSSVGSQAPWPPARSHHKHGTWPPPKTHLCVVVGRGRGSPGLSKARRRGPPSSRPGAKPTTTIERAARVPRSDAPPGERHIDEHPKAAPTPAGATATMNSIVALVRQAIADSARRSSSISTADTDSRRSVPLIPDGSVGTRSIRQSPERMRSRVVNTIRSRPK